MRRHVGRAVRKNAPRHDVARQSIEDTDVMNTKAWMCAVVLCAAGTAQAQAPVEDHGRALQQAQHRAGIAHRELEQARYDAKLAEQDALNARDAHAAAEQQAAARKRELDAAEKVLAAARAWVAAAQKTYDREVGAIDAMPRAAPAAGSK